MEHSTPTAAVEVLPDALAQRLAKPVEPGGSLSVRQLADLLLAKMTEHNSVRYEEADEIAEAMGALQEIVDSGRADEINASQAFDALRLFYVAKYDDLLTEWHEVGKYEARESNSWGPDCFRDE